MTDQFTPDGTAVHTMPTMYTVNCLHGVEGGGSWAVTVTWIGPWEWGRPHGERGDDWERDHRFSLDKALKLAQEAAPGVRMGGMTAAEALEWKRQNPDGAL